MEMYCSTVTRLCLEIGPRDALEGIRQNLEGQVSLGTLSLAVAPELLANLPKVVDERDDECPIKIAYVVCLSL